MKDSKRESRGSLSAHVKDYLKSKADLLKMKAADESSSAITNAASYLVVFVTGFLFLVFGSFSLGFLLSRIFNNSALGFFTVALLYIIAGAIIWANREKWFKLPVLNSLINKWIKEA